jgi:hypothetical protein
MDVDFGFAGKIISFVSEQLWGAAQSIDCSNLSKWSVFCIILRQRKTRCGTGRLCKEGKICNQERAWHFFEKFPPTKPESMPKLADPADLSA